MQREPLEVEEVRGLWVEHTQIRGCASSVAYMRCSAAWGRFVIAQILPFRTVGVES